MAFDKDLLTEKMNPEELIVEIEKWPVIWDPSSDDYGYKVAKKKAWETVIEKFIPNLDDLSTSQKSAIVTAYQRKWKSLRDSYTRERSKQRKEMKAGFTGKFRKQYVFFDQLRFLESAIRPTDDYLNSDEETMDEGSRLEEPIEAPKNVEVLRKAKERPLKRKLEEEFEIPESKFCRQDREDSKEEDNDKLFLLSLHGDLKSLPDHMKLNVKFQILGILSFARQAVSAVSTVPQFPLFSSQGQTPCPPCSQPPFPQPIFNSDSSVLPCHGNERHPLTRQSSDFLFSRSVAETDSTTSETQIRP